eukprot:1195793-Prorocentrum_minimum.AAC.2
MGKPMVMLLLAESSCNTPKSGGAKVREGMGARAARLTEASMAAAGDLASAGGGGGGVHFDFLEVAAAELARCRLALRNAEVTVPPEPYIWTKWTILST